MRIVLTAYGTSGYSGLPKYFYFLAKHLALNGMEVEVIVDSPDRAEKMKEVTKLATPVVISPPVIGMLSKAKYAWNIANYLKHKEFDILHSCDVLPYFYLRQRKRKPVVFQPFSNEMFQLGTRDIRRLFFGVLRSCGQKAEALAVVGEWQLESMLSDYRVSRSKSFILPVCIDVDFVREIAGRRDDVRRQMGIAQDTFVILSVNILLVCKGVDYLIRAMQNVPVGLLIVVSSGPEEQKLHQLVIELGFQDRVIFTGKVSEQDLYNYYAVSDVFVSPTLLNGSSMGIMEAEVFGLPIVSTHQEFLIDGNGYVVPEKNPEALADAIKKVYMGDRAKMGERSKEIVKPYDFKEIAKIAIAKYKEIIG